MNILYLKYKFEQVGLKIKVSLSLQEISHNLKIAEKNMIW